MYTISLFIRSFGILRAQVELLELIRVFMRLPSNKVNLILSHFHQSTYKLKLNVVKLKWCGKFCTMHSETRVEVMKFQGFSMLLFFFLFPSRWSPHSVYFVLWAALQGNSWVWQIVSNGKRHAEFRLSIVCFYRMSFVYEGDCIETYKWKTLSFFSSLIPSNPSRYVLQFFFVHSSCCRVAQFQLRMKITWKTFNFLSANVCVEFSLQVSTRLTCWNLQVKLEGKSTLLAAEIDSCTFSVVCAARVISNFFPLLFIIVLNKRKFLHFSEASREEKIVQKYFISQWFSTIVHFGWWKSWKSSICSRNTEEWVQVLSMNLELISFEWNENMCIFRCGTHSHKQASLKVQHRNDEKFLTHSCESFSICKLNLSISLSPEEQENERRKTAIFNFVRKNCWELEVALSRRWRRSHQPRMCVGYDTEYDDDGFVFLCIFSCINFSLHKFPILFYSLLVYEESGNFLEKNFPWII